MYKIVKKDLLIRTIKHVSIYSWTECIVAKYGETTLEKKGLNDIQTILIKNVWSN